MRLRQKNGLPLLGEYAATAPDMPLKKMDELAASCKPMNDLFQPVLDEAKLAHPLLKAVVTANPDQLAELVKANPEYLFKKGQVKDPAGQVFYNVSAYQLMTFLCDDDMKHDIMQLLPPIAKQMKAKRQEQYAAIDQGGADLIKLNRDPTTIPFDDVLQYRETWQAGGQQLSAIFPLMENPDAIIYYKDVTNQVHWYLANRETRTVEPIAPETHSQIEQTTLDALEASMDAMENNSARRSNDAEHDIIKKTMSHELVRNGIRYKQDGICYRDTCLDFNPYFNTNRKCIRLYGEGKYDEGDEVWQRTLGHIQKRVLWLLQRICEQNRPFFPLPDFKSSSFRRGFKIKNWLSNCIEDVYNSTTGNFITGFGSDFAIYKGEAELGAEGLPCVGWGRSGAAGDLIAVCRLVEDAKTNVVEFIPGPDLVQQGSRPTR